MFTSIQTYVDTCKQFINSAVRAQKSVVNKNRNEDYPYTSIQAVPSMQKIMKRSMIIYETMFLSRNCLKSSLNCCNIYSWQFSLNLKLGPSWIFVYNNTKYMCTYYTYLRKLLLVTGSHKTKICSKIAQNQKIGSKVWGCGSQVPALVSGMCVQPRRTQLDPQKKCSTLNEDQAFDNHKTISRYELCTLYVSAYGSSISSLCLQHIKT